MEPAAEVESEADRAAASGLRQWRCRQRWHYFNRQEGWRSLRAELVAEGKRLSCYSFRHSYSVRGHQLRIDAGSMALAMGHSLEVHCRSYPWATEAGAAAAFERAKEMTTTPAGKK
jgi:integrase